MLDDLQHIAPVFAEKSIRHKLEKYHFLLPCIISAFNNERKQYGAIYF